MLLFTPGPTPVPENIRIAMAGETLHHRTPEFEAIFASAREMSLKLFGMPEVLFLAASGTGAMEAAVINLCRTRALTVNSGKFGQRFTQLAETYGKNPVELSYEWDTPASVADVEKALEAHPDIDALFIQICESAGGLRHPVEEIARAAKAKRPNLEQKRVNLDLPVWMIEQLDREAKRIGVARQAIMKMFLAERLEHEATR